MHSQTTLTSCATSDHDDPRDVRVQRRLHRHADIHREAIRVHSLGRPLVVVDALDNVPAEVVERDVHDLGPVRGGESAQELKLSLHLRLVAHPVAK